MNKEKPVVKCTPKPPKSLAREYNLNTFMKSLNDMIATAVWYDKRFQPSVNKEGWCDLHANLVNQPHFAEFIDLRAHTMETIECGFDIRVPPGFEFYFRPNPGTKLILTDASNCDYEQRRVRVNVINYSTSMICIRHGDHIGEVCVRPSNNIPIIVEGDE